MRKPFIKNRNKMMKLKTIPIEYNLFQPRYEKNDIFVCI